MSLKTWQSANSRKGSGRVIAFGTVSNRMFEVEPTGTDLWRLSEASARPWSHPEDDIHPSLYKNTPCPPKICHKCIRMMVLLGALLRISYANFMPETTDEQLMQQYAKGDAKAFDQLYARHRGALYRYFNRQVNDAATVNDLYQGTWEKIIKARSKYRTTSPFTAWMYRIAHNHLVDHYRRLKPVDSLETDTLTDGRPDPAQDVISGQQTEQLRAGIISLPMEQRTTLLLKLETGLKMDEIASVTGVSRETVKSRLRYAVNKLKRSLLE